MAFSSGSEGGAMADMNIIPLADVMLVLLIIFMATAPPPSFPIDVDLPQRSVDPPKNDKEPPDPIKLRIDESGDVFWDSTPVPVQSLQGLMQNEVDRDPENQPTLEIDVNAKAQYQVLAKVLASAKNANMKKIGFVKK